MAAEGPATKFHQVNQTAAQTTNAAATTSNNKDQHGAPQNTTSALLQQHYLKPHTDELDLDGLIDSLVGSKPQLTLSENQVHELCFKVINILRSQPMLLKLEPPINLLGDIHGQFFHLLQHFQHGGFPPSSNYLFLGDYVDRGKNSLETICLLLAYKIKYPEKIFLLRGNHECSFINKVYGFYDDVKTKYSTKTFTLFQCVFRYMPVAAVVGDVIFCCHGGLSPDLVLPDATPNLKNLDCINNIQRPTDVPPVGILCDLLWADPEPELQGWKNNDRGASYIFGADELEKFLQNYELDLVVRGHQVVEDGYEFFPCPESKKLVTLFSAPKYCGEFDNAGAMMIIDKNLSVRFKIIVDDQKVNKGSEFSK